MKMEQTECSETSAYKIQTLGNYPKESIQQFIVKFINTMWLIFFLHYFMQVETFTIFGSCERS